MAEEIEIATQTSESDDKVKILYNALSQDEAYKDNVGTEEDFRIKLKNPEKAKILYDALSGDDAYSENMGNELEFYNKIGLKKKEVAEPDYGGVSKIFAPKELTPQPTIGVLKSEELPLPTTEPEFLTKEKQAYSTKDKDRFGYITESDGTKIDVSKEVFEKYQIGEPEPKEIETPQDFENTYQDLLITAISPPTEKPSKEIQEDIKRKEKSLLGYEEKQYQKVRNYKQQNPIIAKEILLQPERVDSEATKMRDAGISDRKADAEVLKLREQGENDIVGETEKKIQRGSGKEDISELITKDIVRSLEPDNMRLYAITQEENKIMQKENITEEDYNRIAELSSKRRQFTDKPRLYSPTTGMHIPYIKQPTEEELTAITDEFNNQVEEYKKTDKDLLAEKLRRNYLLYKGLENEYKNVVDKYIRYSQTGVMQQETNISLEAQREGELNHLQILLIDTKLQLDAATEAYLLNENATVLKDKMSLMKVAGLSFFKEMLPENLYNQGVREGIIAVGEREKLTAAQKILTGIKLTDEEEKSFETSISEEVVGGGAGMGGLVIKLMALNKIGAIAGIPQYLSKLEKMGGMYKTVGKWFLNPIYEEVKFGAVGGHLGGGAGFAIAGNLMFPIKLKGSTGAILQPFVDAVWKGAVGGTAGMELAGRLETAADAALENKDFQYRMEQAGYGNMSDDGRRLLVSFLINSFYGISHLKKADLIMSPEKLDRLAKELEEKWHKEDAKNVRAKSAQISGLKELASIDEQIAKEKQKTIRKQVEPSGIPELPKEKTFVWSEGKKESEQEKLPFDDIAEGTEVSYEGLEGTVVKKPEGIFVKEFDSGKETIIEGGESGKSLQDLGVELLPPVPKEKELKALHDRALNGIVKYEGREYFVSLARVGDKEDTIGDRIYIHDKHGKSRPIKYTTAISKKLAIVNAFLEEQGLPNRKELTLSKPPTAEAELQTEAQTKQKPKPDEGKETKVGEKAEGKEGVLTPAPAAVAEGVTEVAPAGEIKAEKPEYEFTSYDDAQKWIEERSKKYGGKNPFYASEEYKKAYPKIKELADIEKDKYGEKAKIAMEESAVAFGDKVFYDYVTPFAVEKYSGEIIKRDGIPYVKLDEGQKTMAGKKSVRWHKGWKKSKVVTKQATETTAPAGEIEILIDKIDKENKFVESLSKSKLESIEKVMNENQKYFEGKYDDSQNIYNVVTDRLKGEGIYEGNPVKDGEAKAEQPISPTGEKAPTAKTTEIPTVGEPMKLNYTREQKYKGLDSISNSEENSVEKTVKEFIGGLTDEKQTTIGTNYFATGKKINGKEITIRVSDHFINETNIAKDEYVVSIEISDDLQHRQGYMGNQLNVSEGNNYTNIEIPNNKRYIDDYIDELFDNINNVEVPKPTKKTYTPEPTESELSIKEKKVREIKRRQVESDFKNQKGGLFRATNYPSRDAVDIHDLGLHYGTLKAAEERAEVRKKINPDVKIKGGELPKNPVSVSGDWGFKQYDQVSQNLLDDGIITKSEKEILDETKELKDVRQLLQKKGYDGIIYRNEIEDKGSISVIKFPLEKGQKPSKYTPEQTAQFEKENAEAKGLGFETGANEALGSINKAMREGRFKGAKKEYDSYAEIPKPELEKYAGERKQAKAKSEAEKQAPAETEAAKRQVKPSEPSQEKPTEQEKELPEFKEHHTTGDKTKAGKYIVEKTEDGIKIFNADTGKTVKQSHQNQWAIEQYIKANIENFRSGKKAEISEGVSSEQIGNYIASESNNPAEIAETWLYSREGRDRTTMTFEEAVYDAAWDIDIDSFKEYYGLGKKDLGGSELKKRLKKDGIPLDMIAERVKGAMELSEEQAEFIESKKGKENELIERIIDFITSSEFESYKPSKETETEIALDSKFRDLTGLPLTESLANKITDYRSGIEKHIDEMKELRNKIPDIDAPFFLAPKLLKVGLDTYIKVLEETKNIRRAINTAIREIEKAALRLGEKFGVREKKDFIDHIRNKREEQKEAIKQAEKISRPATAKETREAVKKIISQERTIEVEERELLKRHFQDLVKGERVGYKKGRAEERERAEVSEAVKKIRKDINEETKNLRKINQQIINESLGIETKTNAERRKEVLKKRHDVEIAIEQLKAKETAEAVAIEAEIIGQKKGRKEGAEAHREKVEIFTELLKEGKSKKFISERAFNYMLGKLGSAKTDLQFERLVELAERVLDKADYIEITTKLNIQRKKLKSRDYGTVQTIAKQFLSINPRHIPIDKLPLYEKMLDALAQKRVPSVKDLMTGYNEIYDSIIKPEPSSKIVNAKELQDNMKELTVRKINTLDEYLAARSEYKKLVGALEKLSKEGNISPEAFAEAQEFLLKTGKTIDEVAGENLIEQANKIKEQAIVDAKMMASETNFSEFTPEQRKEIEKFQSIPQDILMQMSIEDIDSYKKVMAEFDSGMINRTMYELINRANRIKGEKDIGEILSTAIDGYGYGATQATLSKRKVKFSEPKELLNDLVLLGKQYWDEYFGLGGQKPIFKKVVMPIVQKYNEMILEAKVLQSDFYKYSNKVSEVDRTKLKIILNQLDYQSNDIKIKGKPYTFDELPKDLRDYFKTITNPDNEYLGLRTISKSQLKMAQEAYKELIAKYSDADGNLDAQKALDGITKDAKIKNLFEARKNLLENLLKDKVRISTEKRGEQFEERENYEPRFVRQQRPNYGLYESAPETAAAAVEQLLGNPTPNMSLRGGATYGRTDDIYFLSFDLVSDTNNSIQNALRDYYLSDVVKEKLGSLASLMSKEKGDKQAMARELYNAMKDAIVTTFHLDNKTTNNDIKFLERLINSQRTYALAYPPRLFADFTANTLREISSSGGLSMDFRHEAYKDIIDNNYISLIFKAGKFAEERYITSQTMAQKIADAIIPLADTPLQRFSFVNAFKEQFKKLTKEEFNPDEYMKSESYRDKFQKQIEDAAFHAEAISSQRFNAQSPLVAPSKTKWVIWGNPKEKFHPFSQMLGFLQSWNTNDTANMKTKAKQFWSGSSTGRWDAFRDMTGIMASNYAYSTAAIFMGELIKNLAIEAIDDDEKEFVQHLEDMFVNATKNTFNLKGQGEIGAGTILQLMLGRYGNLFRLTYPALSGGIKYGLSDNPEALKKMKPVEDAVRKSAFVVPIQKGDRAENVLRTIPVFGEVALTGMDFGSSLTKITDKVIRDGFENLSEDEQELYTLGRSINAIVSMAYPNPISPTVKRALMASAKAAAKKEKENRMEFVGVEYLYQKTKNKELIPSIPKMSITEKGEEINLTYQQHSEFTQMVMDERKRKVMELKADTEFSMSDDNTKIKKIKSAYLSGYESAKEEFLKKIGAIESGLSPREEAIKKEKARRR